MKKRHLFWIIPSAVIVFFLFIILIARIGHIISPTPSKPLVIKSKAKKTLTEKEFQKDLDYLKYYFETFYAGYNEMLENGYDIDKIIEDIKKDSEKDKIKTDYNTSVFFNAVFTNILKNHAIIDCHFSIGGNYLYSNKLYFSDIYVKPVQKNGNTKYIVVKNEREKMPEKVIKSLGKYTPADIKPGQEFTGPQSMLFEWFDGNEKIYRIGILSRENQKNILIPIDGKKIAAQAIQNTSLTNPGKMQGMRETKDTLYLSLADFMFLRSSEINGYKEFQTLCQNARYKSSEKKQIIIDLRGNPGGNPFFAAMLFSYLFYNKSDDISFDLITYVANLINDEEYKNMSPTFGKLNLYFRMQNLINKFKKMKFKKNKREETDYEKYEKIVDKACQKKLFWPSVAELFYPYKADIQYISIDSKIKELPHPDFEGDIYILTDTQSASCSEYSIALLRKMAEGANINIHHLGENTAGAVYYVDPTSVALPYSGIWITFPTSRNYSSAFNHPDFHGEGYGWFPEYWVTHYNLLNTLNNLINDPELESALQGLEKWQLQ